MTALQQAATDQQLVSTDQSTVQKDENSLAKALSSEQASAASSSSGSSTGTGTGTGTGSASTGGTTTTPAASSAGGTGTTGSTGSTSSKGSSGGSTASNSAAQIDSDQAAIDQAQASLIEAQQALNEAQLSSPIAGTVVSVGLAVGDTVSAGSTTAVVQIIGTKSYEATGTLTSTQVASVKVGSKADVSVDGVTGSIVGTVSQVGPVQSGTSGYSYPVVIALPAKATGLFSGSTANVAIITGGVNNVLAVPTSAVMTTGTSSYVLTLPPSGTLTRKVIKTGMVGGVYTQVVSGLQDGQQVVLADLSQAVPSSNTTATGGFGGAGGGGFGGGGGGGFSVTRSPGGTGATGG